jgi:hypothetical protein
MGRVIVLEDVFGKVVLSGRSILVSQAGDGKARAQEPGTSRSRATKPTTTKPKGGA